MKKILLTLFTFALALNAAAQEVLGPNGSCGNDATWKLFLNKENQTARLSIEGSGKMNDYQINNIPWKIAEFGSPSYYDYITEVTISEEITHIADNAFYGCTSLKTVTFVGNSSCSSIGSNAFYNCTSLTTINVPESVTTFGTEVFSGCPRSLTNTCEHIMIKADPEDLAGDTYTVPESVKYIETGAFNDCTELRYLIFEGPTKAGGNLIEGEVRDNIITTVVPSNLYDSFSASHGPRRNTTTVNVKKDKYTSYAFLHDVTIPAGVVAYTATTDGSMVTFHPITTGKIKKDEGVFLKSTSDNTYYFYNGANAEKVSTNILQGELEAITLYPKDNAYVMQTKNGTQKFYKVDAPFNVPRFKAWLKLDNGNGAKIFSILDEYTTDIEDTEEETEDPVNSRTQVYNMAGQKLSAPQKGLNIINGKIVIK